ncbi:MAG TPA: MoaD/ThiS family protein [Chitinophagaceae bacterium]|nr:MoaD/ThiS family protein [Chitinophagaceae bacterium]
MLINIIIFGRLAEIIGRSSLELEHVRDTDQLQQMLRDQYPLLATVNYRLAVDRQLVDENTSLSGYSTVALLPPFSGG